MQNYYFLADLEVYDLNAKVWSTPIVYTKATLRLRKNHIAELIGNQMFIHGGISEDNDYLDDCFILNLSQMKWQTLFIDDRVEGPALAGHTSCLVLPHDIKYSNRINIYKLPEQSIGKLSVDRVNNKIV